MLTQNDIDDSQAPAEQTELGTSPAASGAKNRRRAAVILLVVAVLAGARLARSLSTEQDASFTAPPQAEWSAPNDAVAEYQTAVASGQPVYILFHSNSCPSCVDITEIARAVLPTYSGSIVFVDAITDDRRARELASNFAFQYIPTSFFVAADGSVADSHTGPLTEDELRERLDRLVQQ